MSQTDL